MHPQFDVTPRPDRRARGASPCLDDESATRPTGPRASRGCTSRSSRVGRRRGRRDPSPADVQRCCIDVREAVEDWDADARRRSTEIAAELERRTRRRLPAEEVAAGHRASATGWPTTTSPSSATASTTSSARATTSTCAASPAPASASCAPTPTSPPSASCRRRAPSCAREQHPAGAGQGQLPRHGAPAGVPRLRRREEVRRERRGHRRATLPRAVLHRGLHRVGMARSRCCARRPTTSCDAVGLDPRSHAGKALMDILETYPRDELFQTPGRRARPDGRAG